MSKDLVQLITYIGVYNRYIGTDKIQAEFQSPVSVLVQCKILAPLTNSQSGLLGADYRRLKKLVFHTLVQKP